MGDRYQLDRTRPTVREAGRDVLHRVLLPAAGAWGAIVALGLVVVGPLDGLPAEVAVNEELREDRAPLLDTATRVWTNIGGTEFLFLAGLATVALLWWRTRQWWFAVVPALALTLQSTLFVTSAFVVGRERPDIEHLDEAPPTSGYPSGHTGASTAFYLVLALLSRRIAHPVLRNVATGLCLLIPLLVAYSRLYRGMHHLSDVVVGLLNGVLCAALAWCYLRRRTDAGPMDGGRADAGLTDGVRTDAGPTNGSRTDAGSTHAGRTQADPAAGLRAGDVGDGPQTRA